MHRLFFRLGGWCGALKLCSCTASGYFGFRATVGFWGSGRRMPRFSRWARGVGVPGLGFRVSGLGLGLGKGDVRLCRAELGDYYGRICLPCFLSASELSALFGLIYNPKPQTLTLQPQEALSRAHIEAFSELPRP